jgi:hypothetical protein
MGAATSATLWTRAASALEMLTGAALLVAPSVLARLLFGSALNESGETVGRISGLVMLCLAWGCWLGESGSSALAPMLALNALAALYLVFIGLGGANAGVLLWPAAALHLVLAIFLAPSLAASRRAT